MLPVYHAPQAIPNILAINNQHNKKCFSKGKRIGDISRMLYSRHIDIGKWNESVSHRSRPNKLNRRRFGR